jgi:hypothetical protein
VVIPECFLQRVKLTVSLETLDRNNLGAVHLDSEDRARLYGLAVEKHGAGPTLRRIAADVRSRKAEVLAQQVDKE